MHRHFSALLLISAGLSVFVPIARGAFVPPLPIPESNSDDARARALRQALFKKPDLSVPEPQMRSQQPVALRPIDTPIRRAEPAPKPPATAKTSPVPKPAPPPVAPPPPREVSLAERELALQPTPDTPYDRYTGSVRTVISRLAPQPADFDRVRDLMRQAHGFLYRPSDPYRAALPAATAASRSGDCKAKSLWLYDRLGDPGALYVIGKMFKQSKANHAWLYWRAENRWWILDPTNRSVPIAADSVTDDRYVPYYSFGKMGAFRHRATRRFLPDSAPEVASTGTGARPRVARR